MELSSICFLCAKRQRACIMLKKVGLLKAYFFLYYYQRAENVPIYTN